MRIPFDSLSLAAVTHELQQAVGARVQKIVQTDPLEVVLGMYAQGREYWFLLSIDPLFARAHFVTKRPRGGGEPSGFLSALRARLQDSHLKAARQVRFDRILEMHFQGAEGDHTLIAELMGKHSNIALLDSHGRIVSVAKSVPPSKSSRPLLGGRPYVPPPFPPKPPIWEAKEDDDPRDFEGASPFLLKLNPDRAELKRVVLEGRYEPVLSPGHGAYAISVRMLELPEHPRESLSIALEQHHALAVPAHQAEQLRSSLTSQLERVLLARETALADLKQSVETAERAPEAQLLGELILAYQHAIAPGASSYETFDYSGSPIAIKLDPDKTPLENANAYFDKAKRAKGRRGFVEDQIARLSDEQAEIGHLLERVRLAERLTELEEIRERAAGRRWLHTQPDPSKGEERPFEGHRVREVLGPGGFRILYGENATSNDYLTLRVAKPTDWWLHVRGGVSAHVVIQTQKHPEKVQMETLLFAAKLAVANSPSKHSTYVPVDYTLKKFVRKPKGAPAGTALYTHEKTLHI